MLIDTLQSTPLQNYKILSNTIIPRPIAWVSTIFPDGGVNLAPFSFFGPMSVKPPIFSLCMMSKSDGLEKDSFKNIIHTHKASISMCESTHLQALHESSTELDFNVSESTMFNIPVEILQSGYPPVPKGVKVAFMCDLYDILELGEAKSVLLEAKYFYISDDIYKENLHLTPNFIARVGRTYRAIGGELTPTSPQDSKKADIEGGLSKHNGPIN